MATKTLKVNVTITISTIQSSHPSAGPGEIRPKINVQPFLTQPVTLLWQTNPWRKHRCFNPKLAPKLKNKVKTMMVFARSFVYKFITFIHTLSQIMFLCCPNFLCLKIWAVLFFLTIIFVPYNTCLPFWFWHTASVFIISLHIFCVAPS